MTALIAVALEAINTATTPPQPKFQTHEETHRLKDMAPQDGSSSTGHRLKTTGLKPSLQSKLDMLQSNTVQQIPLLQIGCLLNQKQFGHLYCTTSSLIRMEEPKQ